GGEVRVQSGLEGIRPQGWDAPRPSEFVAAPMLSLAVAGTLPPAAGCALLPPRTGPAPLALDRDAFPLRAVLRQGHQEFVVTAADHEVELVRRRPSVESAARDQLGDAGFIIAE